MELFMLLQIVFAPNTIFKQIAQPVKEVTAEIRQIVDDMFHTLEHEKAVGIGANMVGILKRIAVVNLHPNGKSDPHCFINPEIIWHSEETQIFTEASLCFPGISAEITRSKAIKIKYLDYHGKEKQLEAEGFFATVIQHEIDYLNGKVFLDYLSKMKRDNLLKKMQKFIKQHPPHVHGEHCHH
jgi:peptide deformylase